MLAFQIDLYGTESDEYYENGDKEENVGEFEQQVKFIRFSFLVNEIGNKVIINSSYKECFIESVDTKSKIVTFISHADNEVNDMERNNNDDLERDEVQTENIRITFSKV